MGMDVPDAAGSVVPNRSATLSGVRCGVTTPFVVGRTAVGRTTSTALEVVTGTDGFVF